MNSDYIVIERELLKHVLDENKKMKEIISKYEMREKREEPMIGQISIEEYLTKKVEERILRLKNGNKMCNKNNKGETQGK